MVVLISICPSSINFSIEALIKEAFIPLSIVKKNAGITRDVGALPNISGYVTNIKARGRWNGSMESTSGGALEATLGNASTGDTGGNSDLRLRINLNAANSSGIYKSIEVVQPASLRCLACIKF